MFLNRFYNFQVKQYCEFNMTTFTTNNIQSTCYIVREFPNTINTVILQFRQLVDNQDTVGYYIITQEPTGTNRRETKFASQKVINFDPYVRWIDSRYFIISTGLDLVVNKENAVMRILIGRKT